MPTSPATSASRRPTVAPLLAGACLIVFGCVSLPSAPLRAQEITALSEVVPFAELETTPDDLIRLATSYADAVRELNTAKLTADTLHQLRLNAVITPLDLQIAQVNVKTAASKAQVVRMIVEKQLAAAEVRLGIVKRIEASAVAEQDPVDTQPIDEAASNLRSTQAEATVNILKAILTIK